MEDNKKKYPVSYFGGDIGAWLCVVLAVAGIMYMLLIRGGGTKSMIRCTILCVSFWPHIG